MKRKSLVLALFTLLIPCLAWNCAQPEKEEVNAEENATTTEASNELLGCYKAKISDSVFKEKQDMSDAEVLALDFIQAMSSLISIEMCFQENGFAKFDGSFGSFDFDDEDHEQDSLRFYLNDARDTLFIEETDDIDIDPIPIEFTEYGFRVSPDSVTLEMHKI